MKKKSSFLRSLLWIFCSAVAINGLAYAGIQGYLFWQKLRNTDYKIPIKAIIQTGPQKEALKTAYLAEILGLSDDCFVLSANFDTKEATRKLLDSPVIREAEVRIKEPGILYIDYTTRQPLAFLLDFENVALDGQGYPFPLAPFFSPKKLPEVYLGIEKNIEWNRPITGPKMALAFDLLKILNGPIVGDLFNVKRIDVSHAFEESYGRREIVLFTQDEIYTTHGEKEVQFIIPRILRLSSKHYAQGLSDYLTLRERLLVKEKQDLQLPEGEQTQVVCPQKSIDLRISQLAFIDEEERCR